jgi:ribosomal protein S8
MKLKDSGKEAIWGQLEKIGKGAKANYDPERKTITFCFNRSPEASSDILKKSRERLIQELKEQGFVSRVKYNGEVVVDNIAKEELVLEKKNHKLIIRLNKKQTTEK